MIDADMHTHTCYSHGRDQPADMYRAALARGIRTLGFSEHSPRPAGYDYRNEYRDKLNSHLDDYFREVAGLRDQGAENGCAVLMGMEMDWLSGEEDFLRNACASADFDYLIGSVHFLYSWGFDDCPAAWNAADQEQCERWYETYFSLWRDMLGSGMFQIAAHPDLIKIFSVERFHRWLEKPGAKNTLRSCLETLKDSGMSMEISSAGLRKPCGEIYPCPQIMAIAGELRVPITFASDAHCTDDLAFAFPELAAYARSFNFDRYVYFVKGRAVSLPF